MAEPIALIIGAGASRPYGLPTGAELRAELASGKVPDCFSTTSEKESLIVKYQEFSHAFRHSGQESIDRFLAGRSEFTRIGKIGVCSSLLKLETAALRRSSDKPYITEDWIGWLFNRLIAYGTDLANWPVRIITFNYDRLIELSIAMMLSGSTGQSFLASLELVKSSLKICHVYGQMSTPLETDRNFQLRINPHDFANVDQASRGIRVIGEERGVDLPEIADAKKWLLSECKTRVFLGFGFDKANCEIIGLGDASKNNYDGRWTASAYGLRDAERNRATSFTVRGLELGHKDDKCHDFLRDKVDI